MASTDALPVPQKNTAYRVSFPLLDADGDLVTGAAGLDSERSLDGATFADVTAEATEIATSSGMYYLDLASGEMNADTVAIIVKTSTSGAKTTPIVMYPEENGNIRVNVTTWLASAPNALQTGRVDSYVGAMATGVIAAASFAAGAIDAAAIGTAAIDADAIAVDAIGSSELATTAVNEIRDAVVAKWVARSNTAAAGAAGTITLDAAASATTDFYKGMLIFLDGATGAGQCRVCTAYNGTSKVANIVPNWATNPDVTSTFVILSWGNVMGVNAQDLTNLDAAISTRATPAQVNTEVLDVLTVDTFAEPAAVAAATDTIKNMINWLKTLARNKITQTSTTQTLRNDADAANIATAAVADDGTTATRAEWA